MRTLILASASPNRFEILRSLGISFDVDVSDIDENVGASWDDEQLVEYLALQKALAVAPRHQDAVIIGADTILICEGQRYGKQHSPDEVRLTLSKYSGRRVDALTGLALVDTASGAHTVQAVRTMMYMRQLTIDEIDAYANGSEWVGKGGGFSIKGTGASFVARIEGNYENIIGLPVPELLDGLRAMGVANAEHRV